MPNQVDVPIGVGSVEAWWFEGAPSKVAAVAANDGDGSFIYADSGGALKSIQFTFPVIAGVADPVTSGVIATACRFQRYGQPDYELYHRWNGARVGSNRNGEIVNTSYSVILYTAATPTLAACNGQHGLELRGWGGTGNKSELWCSWIYRNITFSYPAPGGGTTQENNFAHLASAIVGAIGASLLLREMPALARAIFRSTGTLILPREYEMAHREIAAMKRTVAA